jgi:hypothetical protein
MPERTNRSIPETQAALRALSGSVCVYKEKTFVRLVRVASIIADDWGARFIFDVIPAPGFEHDSRNHLTASGTWQVLGLSDRAVHAAWVGWVLVVKPDMVEQIRLFAPEARDSLELMNRVNDLVFSTATD